MKAIIDKKIPEQAKEKLSDTFELFELSSEGIVYDAISGHPDIFLCQYQEQLFIAPNAPKSLHDFVSNNVQQCHTGEQHLGMKYPDTTLYNAVITERHIIHNFRYSDLTISNTMEDHDPIHVSQGYTRCNLLALKNEHFITSDQGIFRSLKSLGFEVLFIDPEGILLPGFKNGFFGGCCGILEDTVYIIGSLDHYKEGKAVRDFLNARQYNIIQLYKGPFFDGGGIFFI